MFKYLLLTLVLCTSFPSVNATPRSDELLCEEIAEVVLEAVALGYLTKDAAEHVIDGCYYHYLPTYS